MSTLIQLRRGTAAQWTAANPVLAAGEIGIELDTGQFKVGNGSAAWASRPYGGIQGPAGADGTDGAPGTTDYNALSNKPTLGDSAAKNVGTGAGDVAAGNHAHAGVYEPANANIQAHVVSAHAPSNAQKNSDITKAEIEAKLTGEISSHSHAGGGGQAFPVGSVFIAVVSTNPATLLGYGTWSAFGAGRMLVGLDSADADFDTAEETGGAKTVTLTAAQSGLPAHQHQILRERSATTGGATTLIARTSDTSSTVDTNVFTENVAAANASQAHQNMPPYIVCYFWKRTA